jgi:type 1 glutamine amidotransferase
MNRVLLVTDGIFHPPLIGRFVLHRLLRQVKGFQFQHTRSFEYLPTDLIDFNALVIYIHHEKISAKALAALDAFVSGGGGVLGIHTATASFMGQRDYFELLGGRFIEHGEVAPFDVKPVAGSTIFDGLPAFCVVDELYLHELHSRITVHFNAHLQGQNIPVVWTCKYGSGRICYASPGHRIQTLLNPTYQKVLKRGLSWVCQPKSD